MSHYVCNKCNGRYRDEHECPADGEVLLARVQDLEAEVQSLRESLMDLRMRVGAVEGLP